MFKVATILLSASLCSLSVLAEDSIIRLSSQHSVSKTADQFVTTIQEKDLTFSPESTIKLMLKK